MTRLSEAACFMRQAKNWVPNGVNYTEEARMARKYQKEECAGCAHELNDIERKQLQQAIRRGFRFEGKAPLKKRVGYGWL